MLPKVLEVKRSVVIHHDQATRPLLNRYTRCCFNDQTFRIIHNDWIDCRDTFMLISIHNGLKMSEYEMYRLTGFPLINSWARPDNYIIFKKAN